MSVFAKVLMKAGTVCLLVSLSLCYPDPTIQAVSSKKVDDVPSPRLACKNNWQTFAIIITSCHSDSLVEYPWCSGDLGFGSSTSPPADRKYKVISLTVLTQRVFCLSLSSLLLASGGAVKVDLKRILLFYVLFVANR